MENREAILFFDGICNLCNGFIDFLIKKDKAGVFKVASLQGQTAQELLPPDLHQELSTVVLLYDGKLLTKADAVLKVLSRLGPPFYIFRLVRFFPFKNVLYDVVANRRYRLFGRRKSCRVPSFEESQRFLP